MKCVLKSETFMVLTLLVLFPVSLTKARSGTWGHDLFRACLSLQSPSSPRLYITPDSNPEAYAALNQPWNTRLPKSYPLGYFLPQTTTQVQHAVRCGVLVNMKLVPNSGGHSYELFSWGDNTTAVIDFRNMRSVSLEIQNRNDETPIAVIQPGALLAHVNAQLWSKGRLFIPLGTCASVGIGGLALGGGWGYFTPIYGLAVDNIVELEMVDAAGNAVVMNEDQNPDLFWGARGAGLGYLGIFTKLKFKTYRADQIKVTWVRVGYGIQDFIKVYSAFQNWLEWERIYTPGVSTSLRVSSYNSPTNHPDGEITVEIVHVYDPTHNPVGNSTFLSKLDDIFPPGGQVVVAFPDYLPFVFVNSDYPVNDEPGPWRFLHSDTDNKKYKHLPVLRSTTTDGTTPTYTVLPGDTFPSDKYVIQKFNSLRKHHIALRYFRCRSLFAKRYLTQKEIRRLSQILATKPGNRITIEVLFQVGNVVKRAPSEIAYVHRDDLVNWEVDLEGPPGADMEEGENWMRDFWTAMQVFDGGETYQNYPDLEIDNYPQRFYAGNLEKLVELKREWDPRNYFTNPMSIPLYI